MEGPTQASVPVNFGSGVHFGIPSPRPNSTHQKVVTSLAEPLYKFAVIFTTTTACTKTVFSGAAGIQVVYLTVSHSIALWRVLCVKISFQQKGRTRIAMFVNLYFRLGISP